MKPKAPPVSAYERERLRNIKNNEILLLNLALIEKPAPKKKKNKPKPKQSKENLKKKEVAVSDRVLRPRFREYAFDEDSESDRSSVSSFSSEMSDDVPKTDRVLRPQVPLRYKRFMSDADDTDSEDENKSPHHVKQFSKRTRLHAHEDALVSLGSQVVLRTGTLKARPKDILGASEYCDLATVVDDENAPDLTQLIDPEPKPTTSTEPTARTWSYDQNGDLDLSGLEAKVEHRLTESRMHSLALHPSALRLLVAAGDRSGQVSVLTSSWSDSAPAVYQFRPHSNQVNCVSFGADDKLYSCAFDGSVRALDFGAQCFQPIYQLPERSGNRDFVRQRRFSSFDFTSPNTMVVLSQANVVSLIDTRTYKRSVFYRLSPAGTTTVSSSVHVHPFKKEEFVVANQSGASVYDLRFVRQGRDGQKHQAHFNPSVATRCASYSPVTGLRLLSCTSANTLHVYDMSHNTRSVDLQESRPSNPRMTRLRPQWLANSEDLIISAGGSTIGESSAGFVQLFSVSSKRQVHKLETPNSVCSVVASHPSVPVLCAGDSRGFVYLWQ